MPNTVPNNRQRVHVAAGVVVKSGSVLIAQRHANAHQGGLWEFPGGKLESGESVEAALGRELNEEMGVTVRQCRPLMQVAHDYGDKSVLLDFLLVEDFSGQPQGREGQRWLWCPLSELTTYAFPEANQPVVDHLLEIFKIA
ncbi:8-oxo-dGTP diphosphatase MutT [Litorivivens sp.]